MLARDVEQAQRNGARLRLACEIAGLNARTLQRWKAGAGLQRGDGRPNAVRPAPARALSAAERERVLQVANEPRFADTPAARIVPMLADEGVYLASESKFARVLREHGQNKRRGRARPPTTSTVVALYHGCGGLNWFDGEEGKMVVPLVTAKVAKPAAKLRFLTRPR